jgi:hypothetical protein
MNRNIVIYLNVQAAVKFKSETAVEACATRFGHGYKNKPLLRGAAQQKAHGMSFGPGGRHIRLVQRLVSNQCDRFHGLYYVTARLAQAGEPRSAYKLNTYNRELLPLTNSKELSTIREIRSCLDTSFQAFNGI